MKIVNVLADNLTIPYPGEVRPAWQPGLVLTSHNFTFRLSISAMYFPFGLKNNLLENCVFLLITETNFPVLTSHILAFLFFWFS